MNAALRRLAPRLLMLPVIWGLVVAGWYSLATSLLARELPGLQQDLIQQASAYARRLNQLEEKLGTLADDGRIGPGSDETTALNRRRALYEFGYLTKVNDVHVLDPASGEQWRPAGAPPLQLAPDLVAQAMSLPRTARAQGDSLLVMEKHARQPVLLVIRFPLRELRPGGQPGRADNAEMVYQDGNRWLNVQPQNGRSLIGRAPAKGTLDVTGGLLNTIGLSEPVPGWAGWWVSRTVHVSSLNGTVFFLQLGLAGAGVLLSALLLLAPRLIESRRTWKDGVQQAREPALGAGTPPYSPAGGPGSRAAVSAYGTMPAAARTAGFRIHGPGGPAAAGMMADKGEPAVSGKLMPRLEKQKQRDELEESRIVQTIKRALASDGVRGVYQPIFRAGDGVPVMHEVLLRLIEPNGAEIPAAEFVKAAKTNNLMPQLDAALLMRMLQEHYSLGQRPATPLALNVSSRTLNGLAYMREVMEKIPPAMMSNLVFEIGSRELLTDRNALEYLLQLKDMGAKLSVDYFGGGRTMLEGSKQMGFDYVKLNAQQMWQDMNSRRELIGLAKIAAGMKLPLVLERVEEQAVEVFARRIGIPYVQGYHFARPGPNLVSEPLPGWRQMVQQKTAAATVDDAPDA